MSEKDTVLEHPAVDGLAPGNGYSPLVVAEGRLVVISGQVALDAAGRVVGEGDVTAQAHQVFGNLERCLKAAGATFADVVKLGFYVTRIADLPEVRVVRDAYIDLGRPPASTAVEVSALIRPELLLEVEAYAVIPW
ncbi:RidA family protein [Streptomyces sp. UH6]|uniref:RidA family protein n=1 Tax=Streptomyces sp. UH6 TaxID=2748379 RepID=UPI0015D50A0D|nr:RidA family protein [Streptomyces sp. UH6]NYV78764.1 RidA family protein [Streptomyces sp. UH6]